MVDVIYEDNHILVCVKPQNVPSQSDSSGDMDMLSMVKTTLNKNTINQVMSMLDLFIVLIE